MLNVFGCSDLLNQENKIFFDGGGGASAVLDEIKRKSEAAADAARDGDAQQVCVCFSCDLSLVMCDS